MTTLISPLQGQLSVFAFDNGYEIVPVELTSFTISVSNENITLNWTTSTETNNRGFEVEKLFGSDWTVIDFVEGSGTTTEPKSYSFRDENLEAGIYKYRLKQIDFDGTFEYSDIVEAEVTIPVEYYLSQNYPNPFNPSTSIKYAISSRQLVSLKVYDVLGKEVTTLVNEEKPAGSYEVKFDASKLSSGIYFYKLQSGSFVETRNMILMK
ncbi:MAG: T9SS type A sorting domain-containing protein [Ignavibacteriales bacterium]|nr:T9SS type A sorting domain-containing protein [Ignavibacteriales bacterium]